MTMCVGDLLKENAFSRYVIDWLSEKSGGPATLKKSMVDVLDNETHFNYYSVYHHIARKVEGIWKLH